MGFPVGYSEVFMPKIFIRALFFLGYIQSLILSLFRVAGLSEFVEPEVTWPEAHFRVPEYPPMSAVLIREVLPVTKYAELMSSADLPESCAVCLYEFEGEDEIRWLNNCKHIFHRCCLDRWMDHDQNTCPLCRTSLVPVEMRDEFNQRLWAASGGDNDFFTEYSAVSGEL